MTSLPAALGSAAMALLPTWAMCPTGQPSEGVHARAQADEDVLRTVEVRIRAGRGADPGGGFNLRGEQCPRPHEGVVGHDARVADGGEGGRPDDPEWRRWNVDRRVLGRPDADIDGGADVRV